MKKILSIVAVVFVALVVIGVVAGKKDSPAAPAAAPAASSESAPIPPSAPAAAPSQAPAVQSGNVMVLEDCTIEIKSHEVLQPGEGVNLSDENAIILFRYDITNTSGSSWVSASGGFMLNVDAIQDNDPSVVNQLTEALLIDNDTGVDQTATIKKDATVPGLFGYDLTDLETPVVLRVSDFDGLVYEQEFALK